MVKELAPVTAREVDEMAVLKAKIAEQNSKLEDFKIRARKVVGPGNAVEGTAYVLNVSKEPEKHGKVDYRALALKYMKLAKVDNPAREMKRLEAEADEEIVDYGTPTVSFDVNPNYRPR